MYTMQCAWASREARWLIGHSAVKIYFVVHEEYIVEQVHVQWHLATSDHVLNKKVKKYVLTKRGNNGIFISSIINLELYAQVCGQHFLETDMFQNLGPIPSD